MRTGVAALGLVAMTACAGHGHAGMWADMSDHDIETVAAPPHTRCEALRAAPTTFTQCQRAVAEVTAYLRHLSTGDEVCLEGGFGDDRVGDRCKARGHVLDADPHGFLIQIRDPSLDSRWASAQGRRIYFENGALVDLYLRERGYE